MTGKTLVVHHIDGNHSNDVPENRMIMTNADHSRLHASLRWQDPVMRERMTESMSRAALGNQYSVGHQNALGHVCSPEACEKMSRAQNRPEVREKNRQANLGNQYAVGHVCSPEACEKISQAMREALQRPGVRERYRQAALGNQNARKK